MNKVSFILRKPKVDKPTSIVVTYACKDGRLKYYTGEFIHPKLWPLSIPKGTRAVLNRIEDAIEQTITDCKIKAMPLLKATLVSRIDALLDRRTVARTDFFTDAEAVIEKMESGLLVTPQNKRYTPGTLKRIRHTLNQLKAFDPALKAESITIDTYNRFVKHCQAKGLSNNTTDEFIKNWKSLGRHIGTSPVFDDKKFKRLQEETQDISLDEKELKAIMDLDLEERYAVVRDWFVIGCYTALRVSDLLLLTNQNLYKNFIAIANEKTDEKVVIPIHKKIKPVLKLYGGFPPKITAVEINRCIKKIAAKAKINGTVLITATKGGKRHDQYLKKWEMVSSHTMRRSYITNSRKQGMPDLIVMKIAGIKSAKTLNRYSKLSPEEAATIAAGLPFYK